MTPLCELGMKHGTDKVGWHNYTPVYYDLLKDRKVKALVEIGVGFELVVVQNQGRPYRAGASLFMWEEFFPDALIIGLDHDLRAMCTSGRVLTLLADQSDPKSLRAALCTTLQHIDVAAYDVIIDDGSHVPEHQIISMLTLLPYLAEDGIYIIEDVYFCSPEFILEQVPWGFVGRRVEAPGPNPPGFLLVIERTK
jgi:hypothetical protein